MACLRQRGPDVAEDPRRGTGARSRGPRGCGTQREIWGIGQEGSGVSPGRQRWAAQHPWTSESNFSSRFPATQPPPGRKDPSQIKIAGKEQPQIVLRKSREIRGVSCGPDGRPRSCELRPAEDRLADTCDSAVSQQNFLLLQPQSK